MGLCVAYLAYVTGVVLRLCGASLAFVTGAVPRLCGGFPGLCHRGGGPPWALDPHLYGSPLGPGPSFVYGSPLGMGSPLEV